MLTDETIFLTGFPGFIASRLVRRLAKEPGRYFLLVQPAFVARAHIELKGIAGETGRSPADFVVLEGDITQPQLGMSPADLDRARVETTTIFHLAAIYDLAVARAQALLVERIRNPQRQPVCPFVAAAAVSITMFRPVTSRESAPALFMRMSFATLPGFATSTRRQSIWRSLKLRS